MSLRRTALIGRGIQYSLSPELHERAARRMHIQASYQLLDADVDGFGEDDAMSRAANLGLVGANVTQPFKEVAYRSLTDIDPVARAVGAVNTVVYGSSGPTGYNTDVDGFGAELDLGIGRIDGSRVVQFGAGGAGAATAVAQLERNVAQLWIIDVHSERAQRLIERLGQTFGSAQLRAGGPRDVDRALREASGIVNASTSGSASHPGTPLPSELLSEGMWVADVLYAPAETQLLRDARRVGARTSNGGRMLVHQAAKSFELFHGATPAVDDMWLDFLDLSEARA